jgi:hypothetical protein
VEKSEPLREVQRDMRVYFFTAESAEVAESLIIKTFFLFVSLSVLSALSGKIKENPSPSLCTSLISLAHW